MSDRRGIHVLFFKACDRDWINFILGAGFEGYPRTGLSDDTWPGYIATLRNITLNTWVHVAQVYNGRANQLFINGIEVASAAATINLALSNQKDLIIGSMNCWPYFFNSDLDDLRFYNRSLTYDEIKAIFVAENGPIESIKAGSWSDLTTWSCGCLPTNINPVLVHHVVNIPSTQTGNAFSVKYGVGARVDLGKLAKLELIEE